MLAVSKPSRLLFAILCTALLTLALPTGSALADRGHGHKYAKLSDYVKKAKWSRHDRRAKRSKPAKHVKRLKRGKYAKLFRNARQNQHEVCQELKGKTRGLYGLCLVYCESQSCDAKSAEAGQCTRQRFGERVLENYNRIREIKYPDAPNMPCLKEPTEVEVEVEVEVEDEVVTSAASCPCVTEQEVTETDWRSCEIEGGQTVLVGERNELLTFDPENTSCTLTNLYYGADPRESSFLDEQQVSACSTMVEMATERNNISCADPSEEEANDNY